MGIHSFILRSWFIEYGQFGVQYTLLGIHYCVSLHISLFGKFTTFICVVETLLKVYRNCYGNLYVNKWFKSFKQDENSSLFIHFFPVLVHIFRILSIAEPTYTFLIFGFLLLSYKFMKCLPLYVRRPTIN